MTIEEFKEGITSEMREEMLDTLNRNTEVPSFLKDDKRFQEVWVAGCWLNDKLNEAGCSDELKGKILMSYFNMLIID